MSKRVDNIPAKVIKPAGDIVLAPWIADIFNTCIETGIFPDGAKLAEVSPIYKKLDPSEKKNYRPVSILTTTSKIFEKLIEQQLVRSRAGSFPE